MEESTPLKNGWQVRNTIKESMIQMFHAELWTDISFRCLDQSEENHDDRVKAHKIVLAARSPVFEAMFFGPCRDTAAVIEIKDAESVYFRKFLECLYCDEGVHQSHSNEDMMQIIQIAHKYQVQTVYDDNCRKLIITNTNACLILDMALAFEDSDLIQKVCTYIDDNAADILNSEGFLNISQGGLIHILKRDCFHVSEVKIFEGTMTWAKNRSKSTDGKVLRQTLGEAFYYLRTPVMTVSDFFSCSKRKGFYSVEEYEDIIEKIVNPSKCCRTITSNCSIPRKPRTVWIQRLPKANAPLVKGQAKQSISETVLIRVAHTYYLSNVKLVYNKSKFLSQDFTSYCIPVEKRIQSSMDITVTLDDIKLEFQKHHEDHLVYIDFFTETPLHPGKIYKLTVKKESKIKGHLLVPKVCNDTSIMSSPCPNILYVGREVHRSQTPSIIFDMEFDSEGIRIWEP